jgi:arsenate reductase (thioredoxin)
MHNLMTFALTVMMVAAVCVGQTKEQKSAPTEARSGPAALSNTAEEHQQGKSAKQLQRPRTVVFVCEHGAAKSVIAAAYFNQLAAERHLPFHAIARGITPQSELSQSAMAGLRADGVAVANEKPRALTADDTRHAARIVAFCQVPASLRKGTRVEQHDVPAPGDGYAQSRSAILAQVKALVEKLQK